MVTAGVCAVCTHRHKMQKVHSAACRTLGNERKRSNSLDGSSPSPSSLAASTSAPPPWMSARVPTGPPRIFKFNFVNEHTSHKRLAAEKPRKLMMGVRERARIAINTGCRPHRHNENEPSISQSRESWCWCCLCVCVIHICMFLFIFIFICFSLIREWLEAATVDDDDW